MLQEHKIKSVVNTRK